MRKLMTIIFALSLLTFFSLAAQDATQQDNVQSGTTLPAKFTHHR